MPEAGLPRDAASAENYGSRLPLLSRRGFLLRRILVATDLLALVLAVAAALILVPPIGTHITLGEQLLVIVTLAPLFVALGYVSGLYHLSERHIDHTLAEDLGPTATAVTAWVWLVLLGSTFVADAPLRAWRFALLWGLLLTFVLVSRALVRRLTRPRAWYRQRMVVIGSPLDAKRVLRRIERHPEWGVEPLGSISPAGGRLRVTPYSGSNRFREPIVEPDDTPEGIIGLLAEMRAERVMLAGWAHSLEDRTELIRRLATAGVHVDVVSGEPEALCAGASLHHIEGMPVMTVRPARINRAALAAKRTLDVVFAGAALLALAPLLAYIAARIKLDSKGPVLFRHKREGRDGRVFEVLKFRTMVEDADELRAQLRETPPDHDLFKLRDDPRVTPYGAALRRRSLDELPQLWNVLRGDMSIVGPRPLPLDEAPMATDHFADRASLRPGMTGPWQIHGRSDIPFDDMVKLDYSYVSTWSLQEDLRLMIRTVGVVLAGRGAY